MNTNSLKFFKNNRFDVAAKLIYAEFFMKQYESEWGKEIYLQHLKVWNNFKEAVEPTKDGKDIFVKRFNDILKSIKNNGFDKNYPVLINDSGELINGSHRLASSIYNEVDCEYSIESREGYGQSDCFYHYFENKKDFVPEGFSGKYLDAMAIEYCKRKKNTFIISLFPIATNKVEIVENIIKQKSNIVYKKIIKINKNKILAKNILWHLYYKEEWIGNLESGLSGIEEKYNLCFNNNNEEEMIFYLIDCEEEKIDLKDLKMKIRNIFNVGNHSVHINDTHEQTLRISNMIFNKNSIFAMSKIVFNKNLKNFNILMDRLRDKKWNDNFCVTSSFVMGLFGIREINDLDYISFKDIVLDIKETSNHFSEKEYYSKKFDDIIFNPNNYFHFNTVKFCTLDIVKEMKNIRKELKDIEDIGLIENFYGK